MSVRDALLYLIAREDCGVGQLQKNFHALTGSVWPVNIGQVYQTVGRLERDGLIESMGEQQDPDSKRDIALYRATDQGRVRAAEWLQEPSVAAVDQRDELTMKIVLALASGEPAGVLIDQQRNHVLAALRQALAERNSLDPGDSVNRLLLEKHIFALEAVTHWLNYIDEHTAELVDPLRDGHPGGEDS